MTDRAGAERLLRHYIESAVLWIPSDGPRGPNGLDATETINLLVKRLSAALASVPAACELEPCKGWELCIDGCKQAGKCLQVKRIPAAEATPSDDDRTAALFNEAQLKRANEEIWRLRTQLETGRLSFGDVIRENDRLKEEIEQSRASVEEARAAEQKRCADIASQNYALMFTKREHREIAQKVARQIFRAIRDGSSVPSTERS